MVVPMELSVNPRDHELTSHMTLTVLHLAGAAVSESFTTFPTRSFIFIYIHEGTARCRDIEFPLEKDIIFAQWIWHYLCMPQCAVVIDKRE